MSRSARWFVSAPDVETLEERDRGARVAHIVLVALFAIFIAWACLAPLSGAVMGSGVVKVEMNRLTVQHQEGGIIRQVLVRDGDKVKAGQPLIVLRDVRVHAAYDLLRSQLDSALARAARLDAERTGATMVSFTDELLQRARDPGVEELLARERTLFVVRGESIGQQIQLIREQVQETRAEIGARLEQLTADRHALTLQREELEANEALLQQGYVSRLAC